MCEAWQAQASDPTMTGDALREIEAGCEAQARGSREAQAQLAPIRALLAANPGAPGDLLFKLFVDHAGAVLDNPAMALALLDRPDFFETLRPHERLRAAASCVTEAHLERLFAREAWRRQGMHALLTHPRTPTSFFGSFEPEASADFERIATHPRAPGPSVDLCLEHPFGKVRRLAAAHPALPAGHLERLRRAGATEGMEVQDSPPTPLDDEELRWLAGRGYFSLLLLAHNPAARAEHLDTAVALAMQERDPELRLALARSPGMSGEQLDRLAGYHVRPGRGAPGQRWGERMAPRPPGEALYRCVIARHPHALSVTLARLADDPYEAVRAAAATHPALPPARLAALGLDEHPAVALEALKNEALPADVIDRVVPLRPPSLLGLQAALHPNTSKKTLEALVAQRDPGPSEAASKRLARGGFTPLARRHAGRSRSSR